MNLAHIPGRAEAAIAQPLTSALIAEAGVRPGMRAIDLGTGVGDVAFLIAERVGPSGRVAGIDADAKNIKRARSLARRQRFENVEFYESSIDAFRSDELFDVVIGRFVLFRQPDPSETVRRAALLLRPGGRIIFQEWHFESMTWPHTSAFPDTTHYRDSVERIMGALRRDGTHVDMGLRLANVFSDAGLPVPELRLHLQVVDGGLARGHACFADAFDTLAPAVAPDLAKRLQQATVSVDHVFLPLQVGAWTRIHASNTM